MNREVNISGIFFLFCSIIVFLLVMPLKLLSGYFSAEGLYITATILHVFLELAVLFFLLKRPHAFKLAGFKKPSFLTVIFTALLVFLTYPFLSFIARLFEFLMPDKAFNLSDSSISVLQNIGPVMGFLIIAVLPAVSEELIFRGYIFGVLRKRSFMCAITISTLSFAIIHGNFNQIVYTALLGVLLCLIREISGSVFPGMIGHALFNSVSVYSIYTQPSSATSQPPLKFIPPPDFITFWLINSRLFIISMIGLALAVIAYAILKKQSNFTFNFSADKKQPLISIGYIAGWVASILLSFI